VPTGDTDCDGFTNAQELFVGTDPNRACGVNAWPPDINNDLKVNLSDVLKYVPVFNSSAPGPPYNVRYDLNGDSKINLSDVLMFVPFFNRSCTP
jgi:Bacterial TSP3 repeat/Dockerin type I domain